MADVRDAWNRAIVASALPDRLMRLCFALRLYCDAGGRTTVGVGRLAADTGLAPRTVKRQLGELVAAGFLDRRSGAGVPGRGGRTSLTVVRIPSAVPLRSGDTLATPLEPQGMPESGVSMLALLGSSSGDISPESGVSMLAPKPYRTIRERGRAPDGAPASQEERAAARRMATLQNSAALLRIPGLGPSETLDELEARVNAAHAAKLRSMLADGRAPARAVAGECRVLTPDDDKEAAA